MRAKDNGLKQRSGRWAELFQLGIRQKVVLILLGTLVTGLTVSGWFNLQEQEKRVYAEVQARGTQLARLISSSLANQVVAYDYHGIQLFLEDLARSAEVSYVRVLGPKGNVMAEVGPHTVPDLELFSHDVRLGTDVIGRLEVGIGRDAIIAQMQAQREALILREALVIAFILLAEFVVLSRVIVRPIRIISATLARSVDRDDVLPDEIPLQRRDELGTVARHFNALRARLDVACDALHGKIAAADQRLRETNQELLHKSQQLERINAELQKLTITDPLTETFNRRQFEHLMRSVVAGAIERAEEVSILLVDIDHFKRINDRQGHEVGDRVLRNVARILSGAVRKGDSVCRIGGEEFFVLCPATNAEAALAIADKLRHIVAESTVLSEMTHGRVTVSIGAASAKGGTAARSHNELFRQADAALYHCKTHGRNHVAHFTQLPTPVSRGRSMP
jgi:diguanylate cyclase (GGDEF)-like protein